MTGEGHKTKAKAMNWNILRLILVFQMLFNPQTFSHENDPVDPKVAAQVEKIAADPNADIPSIEIQVGTKDPVKIKADTLVVSNDDQEKEFITKASQQPAIIVADKNLAPELDWHPLEDEKKEHVGYFTKTTPEKLKAIWKKMKDRFIDNQKNYVTVINMLSTSSYFGLGTYIANPNESLGTYVNLVGIPLVAGILPSVIFYRQIFPFIRTYLNKDLRSIWQYLRNGRQGDVRELPGSSNFERVLKIFSMSTSFYGITHAGYWIENPDHRDLGDLAESAAKGNFFNGIVSSYEILTTRAIDSRYQAKLKAIRERQHREPTDQEKERAMNEATASMVLLTISIGWFQGLAMMLSDKGFDVAYWGLVVASSLVTFEIFRPDLIAYLRRKGIGRWACRGLF